MRQTPVQQRTLRIPCTGTHNLIGSPVPLFIVKYAALFILLTQVTWAQVSLGLSSGGVQNGVLSLNIVLSSTTGSEPAALQFTLAYPTASVTQAVVTAGPQATAAAKSVSCTTVSGSRTCVLYGLNQSKILNGNVATATLQLSAGTTATPSGIQLTNALATSPAATAVTTSTNSVIQVVPVIRSVLCSPTSITAPASTSCTLTLSAAAPASGAVVSLGAAATGITFSVPASVTVASGQTTATFAINVSAATTSGTVTTTASLNGSSVSSSFSVVVANVASPSGVAMFVKIDTTTQGNWKSVYGNDGYNVILNGVTNPSYVTPVPSGQSSWTWIGSTSDPRALQKATNPADRIAATWYSNTQFTIDMNISDTATHQVALYCLDWDSTGRRQKIDVLNASGTVLNTQTLSSSFHGGVYLVWNVSGHVTFRITWTAGYNAVVSGLFFEP